MLNKHNSSAKTRGSHTKSRRGGNVGPVTQAAPCYPMRFSDRSSRGHKVGNAGHCRLSRKLVVLKRGGVLGDPHRTAGTPNLPQPLGCSPLGARTQLFYQLEDRPGGGCLRPLMADARVSL